MAVLTFGRYRGKSISQIPRCYRQWLLGDDVNIDPSLRDAIAKSLGINNGSSDVPIEGDDSGMSSSASRPPSSPNNYADYLREKMSAGSWSPFFRSYLSVMSIEEAVIIGFLLSLGRSKADDRGWVRATKQFIFNGLSIDPEEQDHIFQALQDKGIVKVQTRPQGRHVKVLTKNLERMLNDEVDES